MLAAGHSREAEERARLALRRRRAQGTAPAWHLPPIALAEPARGLPLVSRDAAGGITLRAHRGQRQAHESDRRFILVLAGKQGGKTTYGPAWLAREIAQTADPAGDNDYIAGTATYDLFKLKMLPALRFWFEQLLGWGRYWSGDRLIELRDPKTGQFWARRADDPMWGRIILRSADSPTGWASATARGGWIDEAGAKTFTRETLEEAQARVAVHQGRLLLTTTIYDLGAIKQMYYDPWLAAGRQHPEINIVQFDSTENPEFSAEEFERLRASMPAWKFNQRYRGIYERPAGMVYDCLTETTFCPRFTIPGHWPRYLGVDFGGVNTAGIWLAEEPETLRLYAYREYHAGSRTAGQHCYHLLQGEPGQPAFCVGGAKSEDQWRREWRKGGEVAGQVWALPVNGPDVHLIEVQIARVYAALATGGLVIFDDLTGLRGDLEGYSRLLDAEGEPTEGIENESIYHYHAALRYIVSRIRRGTA